MRGAGCTGCREHRVREGAEQHGEPLPPRGDTAGRGTAAGRRVTSLCAGGRGTAGPALHRVRSKTVPLRRRSHPRPDTPLSPASPAPGDGSAPQVPGDRSPIAGETRCADSTRALNQHRCSSGAHAGTRLPPEPPKPPVQRRRSPPTPRVPASGRRRSGGPRPLRGTPDGGDGDGDGVWDPYRSGLLVGRVAGQRDEIFQGVLRVEMRRVPYGRVGEVGGGRLGENRGGGEMQRGRRVRAASDTCGTERERGRAVSPGAPGP